MPKLAAADSRMMHAPISGIDDAYIIENDSLERLLFDRNTVGLAFTQACEEASRAFFRHFEPELRVLGGDLAELMLLTKGMYYWLHHAYAAVFEQNLEANFVVTRRSKVSEAGVSIEIPYANFDAPATNLVIADTIASGATMCAALARYLEHNRLANVFVFSIAGSVAGGRVLAEFCRARGIRLHLAYGLAAFGLAPNGFDLSFLHPDTVTSPRYLTRAREVYDGKPISAVGWDFGTQAQSLRKYRMLCWLEAQYWGAEESLIFCEKEPPGDSKLVEKERGALSTPPFTAGMSSKK